MRAISRNWSNSGTPMREASRSAFFSDGILRMVSSRKWRALAKCIWAISRACCSPCFQNAARIARRRSGSASSFRIVRAVHVGCGMGRDISPRPAHAIAEPAHGEDELGAVCIALDLPPQPAHVNGHVLVGGQLFVAPELLDQI